MPRFTHQPGGWSWWKVQRRRLPASRYFLWHCRTSSRWVLSPKSQPTERRISGAEGGMTENPVPAALLQGQPLRSLLQVHTQWRRGLLSAGPHKEEQPTAPSQEQPTAPSQADTAAYQTCRHFSREMEGSAVLAQVCAPCSPQVLLTVATSCT